VFPLNTLCDPTWVIISDGLNGDKFTTHIGGARKVTEPGHNFNRKRQIHMRYKLYK
jgi:hypothetical protein